MYDIVIIGAGPAGISAALYAVRANLKVAVLYAGETQLEKAHKIDNYYGFVDGISGIDLYNNGIEQAKTLGVEVKNEQVTHIEMLSSSFETSSETQKGLYSVKTTLGEYQSSSIIIATGNKKLRPKIAGLIDFEGKGVSYCAVCDGFFYRKKQVAVIGNGEYALEEASYLAHLASSVTILTDGKSPDTVKDALSKLVASGDDAFKKILVEERKIISVSGNGESARVKSVNLDGGDELAVDGVFVALGNAGGADFAKKLGLELEGDSIKTDEKMKTNAPGIFACGNVTGGLLQVCKAVYEGAVAGLSAVEYVRQI